MFRTILVPLDGSIKAEAALPIASQIARRSGASLVLARVVSIATEHWPALPFVYPSLVQAAVDADL